MYNSNKISAAVVHSQSFFGNIESVHFASLHSTYTSNALFPLLFVLISCSAASSLCLSLFYHLSHSGLSLFTLLFIVWFCSLQRLEARQWLCYLELLWPTECATVGLSGGYAEYPQFNTVKAGQATQSELGVQTIPFCLTSANAGLGFMNENKYQVFQLLLGF